MNKRKFRVKKKATDPNQPGPNSTSEVVSKNLGRGNIPLINTEVRALEEYITDPQKDKAESIGAHGNANKCVANLRARATCSQMSDA